MGFSLRIPREDGEIIYYLHSSPNAIYDGPSYYFSRDPTNCIDFPDGYAIGYTRRKPYIYKKGSKIKRNFIKALQHRVIFKAQYLSKRANLYPIINKIDIMDINRWISSPVLIVYASEYTRELIKWIPIEVNIIETNAFLKISELAKRDITYGSVILNLLHVDDPDKYKYAILPLLIDYKSSVITIEHSPAGMLPILPPRSCERAMTAYYIKHDICFNVDIKTTDKHTTIEMIEKLNKK